MSVKVAVRVRPFNNREKEMGAKLCVKMNGGTTSLVDVNTGNTRDFTFDYSLWSHDGFEEMEDGYLKAAGNKYADQQYVYEQLGQQVLDNAWEGYHCCLFAYGQTGSGKSYSMVGYGVNKGIIPIASDEIFKRVDATSGPNKGYEITVSMLEIYNERIQDLLVPVQKRPQGGLKIRENKVVGVFVDSLSKHPVSSYEEIEKLMEIGNTNRSIGATQMNATSSRAHTIFTIEFKQIDYEGDVKSEKLSVINLVDLAGSEKAGQTGATGERLKEGCAINKSLVVLGSVIEALADRSTGKKNIVVPYRDSALTRILSNALGGNSKTVMICALSPATVNYEETLSTLRYADRAKKIKNHAVVNESVQDKVIRELKEENTELKKLIDQAGGLERLKELQEKLESNEAFAREQMMSWEQKRKLVDEEAEPEVDKSGPHMTNLNEDPQLSGRVIYNFNSVPIVVGRKNADPPADIVLSSSSVRPRHCTFDKNEEEQITISPIDETCSEYLFVNGQKVTSPTVLSHFDRIIIGTSTVFLFKVPGTESELKEPDLDYEFAMQEKTDAQQANMEKQLPPQTQAQMQEPQHPGPQERKQSEELEPSKKRQMHSKLAKLFPLANEASLIASDLGRHVKFNVVIMNILPDEVEKEEDLEPENWEKELKVEVVNSDYGLIWLWDTDKFEDRLCMLREMVDEMGQPSPDEDPLWDPPEENLLGKGYYSLKPLGLLFDNPFDILIISTTGGDAGFLRMNIIPVDEDGVALDEGPETPEELVGQFINFRVEISEAWNLPQSWANNVYCEYHFPGLGIKRTNVVQGYSDHPSFNYKEQVNGILVDEFLSNYMQTKKLAISVYGTGMSMKVETPKNQRERPAFESMPANIPSVESEMETAAQRARQQQMDAPQKSKSSKKDKKDCRVF